MFNNAKTPQHCELMTSHLRNRITADGAHFELRLHLIYLTNDVLHHWYFILAFLIRSITFSKKQKSTGDCRGHTVNDSSRQLWGGLQP